MRTNRGSQYQRPPASSPEDLGSFGWMAGCGCLFWAAVAALFAWCR